MNAPVLNFFAPIAEPVMNAGELELSFFQAHLDTIEKKVGRTWPNYRDETNAAFVWGPTLRKSSTSIHAVQRNPHASAIDSRVARLRVLTTKSGNPFNAASAEMLVNFCQELKSDFMPSIFAVVNGNLRSIWRNDLDEQIGIQFIPDGRLQYVLFRVYEKQLIETLGFELNISELKKHVYTCGLQRLWFDV